MELKKRALSNKNNILICIYQVYGVLLKVSCSGYYLYSMNKLIHYLLINKRRNRALV